MSADEDSTQLTFEWDFGDGSWSTEQNPTHLYERTGIYSVSLTVADEGGLIDRYERIVTASNGALSPVGEAGQLTGLTDDPQMVEFARTYSQPVVFAQPPSDNGGDAVVVEIDDLHGGGFSIRLAETDPSAQHRRGELVSWVVLEAGLWLLQNGVYLNVGILNTNATVGRLLESPRWSTVEFDKPFEGIPVVNSQVQD